MRLSVSLLAAMAVAGLVAIGCAQTPAAPAATAVPAAPTKIAEPTKLAEPTKAPAAPTAAPTVAPTKSVVFPEKGKTITIIVPYAAGGGLDLTARLLAPLMEKELGTPFAVVNKAGAAGQVGVTELAASKPDGYTIGVACPPWVNTIYLDPERKATFGRKDLAPIALHSIDPAGLAVKADSPYKGMKDLVDAAKAKPESVKIGDMGFMSGGHLQVLEIQRMAGIRFASVHFDGTAPGIAAILGGHVDGQAGYAGEFQSPVKSGDARLLGIADKDENKFYPGVKTMSEQGVDFQLLSARGLAAPAGTPKEIISILSDTIRKVMETNEHKQALEKLAATPRYMTPEQYAAYWDGEDERIARLLELSRKEGLR